LNAQFESAEHACAFRRGVGSPADVLAIEASCPDPIGSLRSTYGLISQGARIAPDQPALSFFARVEDQAAPRVWTHHEWLACVTRTANMFRRLGLRRTDCVAYVLPNLPQTHWTLWGAEAAGIVFPINPFLEPPMMAELMRATRPRFVVTVAPAPGLDLWSKVCSALTHVEGVEAVLVIDALHHQPGHRSRQPFDARASGVVSPSGPVPVLDFHAEWEAAPDAALEGDEPSLEDVASYFCTGGTTGSPKIAVRTHRTELANALQVATMFGRDMMGPGRTALCGLPLFHVNAQIGTGLAPWSVGGHVVLATSLGYRTPGLLPAFWDIVERHRLTCFSGVPTIYASLLQTPPRGQDLTSLKFGICGAAPMPAELVRRFEAETGVKIVEGYGLTEGGCVSSLNPPRGEGRAGSIGIRLPWQRMAVLILDEAGRFEREAAVNETGVIAISGINLFQGYLDPAHERSLWIDIPDDNELGGRWLHTGDLGRLDAHGRFWLTGRKKELIIRGGHNIDPKVIEEALSAHPAVMLAAAVGRPDGHSGEVPVAYVQLRPGAPATEEELLAFAQARIGERAAFPRHVVVLEALPTTAVGKVFKPALVLREMESVCRAEAAACGAVLTHCAARQDPTIGWVLAWSAVEGAKALEERLGSYTFKTEHAPA
jgi:acyl-CoA synthetase (AMP-forming)/AMP-acid ligase II